MLIHSVSIQAQELDDIITDRPDQTESAETVPKGFFQIEAGVTTEIEEYIIVYPNSKFRSIVLSSPGMLIRYGLTKNIELRLGGEYLAEIRKIESSDFFANESYADWGFSPIEVGVKARLFNGKGLIPTTALLFHVAIPLGREYAFQTDYASPSFRFAFAHELSDRFAFSYNLGYEWELNEGSTTGTGIYTASLGISLVKNLGMFVESYGFLTKGDPPDHRLDAGLTYLIAPNIQADLSGGIGLKENSPDFFFGGGISVRLPR